jgi:hypothetical protein
MGNGNIVVMNADGTGQTILASGEGPVWSPDGAKIAYMADGEIYVMNADSSMRTARINATSPTIPPSINSLYGRRIAARLSLSAIGMLMMRSMC